MAPQLFQYKTLFSSAELSVPEPFLMKGMLPVDTGGEQDAKGSLLSLLTSLLILGASLLVL